MVIIDDIDYTRFAILPIKTQYVRDESLNQGVLTLKNLDRELPFEPLSVVIYNDERWLVGSDNVLKSRCKNKKYQHDITLIEETKLLEKYFVDNCTFTNSLNEVFIDSLDTYPQINIYTKPHVYTPKPEFIENDFGTVVGYKTPLVSGTSFTFKKFTDIFSNSVAQVSYSTLCCRMQLFENGNSIFDSGWSSHASSLQNYSIILKEGLYSVIYSYAQGDLFDNISGEPYFTAQYNFNVINSSNIKTREIHTISEVVDRLLYLAEIQRKGNNSRFIFNKEQSIEYSLINAPQMDITNCTLREALNKVGEYIHRQVRLNRNVIYFDEYSTNEIETIKKQPVYESSSQEIEQFCSEIESNVQNLIPDEENQSGNIIEPYINGYITPRAETGIVEISDNTGYIQTKAKIYKLIKLEIGFLYDGTKVGDVTEWTTEKTIYDIMSSYTKEPKNESKAYHIYWQQGQSGIRGLTWEQDSAVSQVFEKNAITNIINEVTGKNYSDANIEITNLQFRITYLPLINARVKQIKPNLSLGCKKAINAYNQSAFKISSTHYGANMQGVVSRLGNIEKVKTFIFKKDEDLPKLGNKFDNDYTISVIKKEEQTNYYKISLGLSKRFNRQNQFVGINNEQRYYEISENTEERYTLYEDYAFLSKEKIDIETEEQNRTIITNTMLSSIKNRFNGSVPVSEAEKGEISNVIIRPQDKNGSAINYYENINLPVISYPFGNSACYSFAFNNNYGAGNYIAGKLADNRKLQNELRYTNAYGEFEFMGVCYYSYLFDKEPQTYDEAIAIGDSLPNVSQPEEKFLNALIDTGEYPIRIKKDNRENIHFSYQIHCLSSDTNIIIGSGFSKILCVSGWSGDAKAKLYIMDRRIGEYENFINDINSEAIDLVTSSDDENKALLLPDFISNANGKSIVVINSSNNELLFAINSDIVLGQTITLPNLYFRHKIYSE